MSLNKDALDAAHDWVQERLCTGEGGYAEFEVHDEFTLVLDWEQYESTTVVPSGRMEERILMRREGDVGDGGFHYFPHLLEDVADDLAAELDCVFEYELPCEWSDENRCFIN